MRGPVDIAEVLAGPHIKTLEHDGSIRLVVAEPVRFLTVEQAACEAELVRARRARADREAGRG